MGSQPYASNVILSSSNISLEEIEEALCEHPAVLEAGVISMPDPVQGERVLAFVALRHALVGGKQELHDFVRRRITDHQSPDGIVFLIDLPKGPTGKIQHSELRELAVSLEVGLEVVVSLVPNEMTDPAQPALDEDVFRHNTRVMSVNLTNPSARCWNPTPTCQASAPICAWPSTASVVAQWSGAGRLLAWRFSNPKSAFIEPTARPAVGFLLPGP
jgi:hypothetical protein